MTRDEQQLELKNQIAYYKQELAHLRALPTESLLITNEHEELVLFLIATLCEELSNISVYPRSSANGFVL